MNLSMLQMTIQGLEMQKATLSGQGHGHHGGKPALKRGHRLPRTPPVPFPRPPCGLGT